MKTYLFDTLNRYKRFSEKLDAKTILCNKSWLVFNDNGIKEVYIFNKDGSLIISVSGKVSNATWKYIPANKSIIITSGDNSYMMNPAFVDGNILALQMDGTNEYAFLINEQNLMKFLPQSLLEVEQYFEKKETELELKPIENNDAQKNQETLDWDIIVICLLSLLFIIGLISFLANN